MNILIYRLPGEAMQIDRIMDAFAKHYCNQNPNLVDEKDKNFLAVRKIQSRQSRQSYFVTI